MNYTLRGIRAQEREIAGSSDKLYHKLTTTVFKLAVVGMVALIAIGGALGIGAFRGILSSSPDITGMSVTPRGYSTFVYDVEGNQIAKLVSTDSNRIPVSMDMIPQDMKDAFVAIEDERFYEHNGIDIHGIIRAGVEGITSGNFSQGASTITQQLLKNSVFTDWIGQEGIAKWKRKIQEQFLAVELEKNMSKDDILLNYMNTVNLGQNTLGVQSASLRYFGKSVSELTLSECACIAGITQNPAGYNPISHPEDNDARRLRVLKNMRDQGYITSEEHDKAAADDVYSRIQVVNKEQEGTDITTYFVDALTVALMEDLMGLGYNETQAYTLMYSSGLKIYSTQDPRIQAIADEQFANPDNFPPYTLYLLSYALTVQKADGSLENHSQEMLETYFKQFNAGYNRLYNEEEEARAAVEEYKAAVLAEGDEVYDERVTITPQPQASLTISDQRTGYIVAMVGGRGAKEASRTLNRATDSTRQPGSCFKVVSTFAPALDSYGMTLATAINDAPFAYDNGRLVRNHWGGSYRGMYSIRNAIRDSANVVTVKTLTWITPQLGFDYLQLFGFTTLVDAMEVNGQIYTDIQQSLALGGITRGVKNVELNAAYATMANGGVYCKPVYYTKVLDNQGNVLIDHTVPETRRVLK
ncbi:MAG: transglycosylase domain-containing protein [Lachnospiraceae bacterium]|nr:transglycosylase domain-containing protein [Lachnospiraceae bacterium]